MLVLFMYLVFLQYVPNLPESAISFVTCANIPFVSVAYAVKEKMHCNAFQL